MRILIVGEGGREHALAWKVRQSPHLEELFIAPGNAGTALVGNNIDIASADTEAITKKAQEIKADLVIVGPETPLAAGLADRLQGAGIATLGPSAAAARIESSKVFSKELMLNSGIPTAAAESFDAADAAIAYLEHQTFPVVVKADGLAAGKGVTIANSKQEAIDAVLASLEQRAFGDAGARVLVEECLIGPEVSVFAFVDGDYVSPLTAACDYKRAFDGDGGPNTGGMGSFTPPAFWNDALASEIRQVVMEPTVRAMVKAGCPYRGVLYAGLMLTANGPKALEFNCRLGDPETQVIVPNLESDFVEAAQAVATGRLAQQEVRWGSGAGVGVVVASGGYPGSYKAGLPISGIEAAEAAGALVFQAGTQQSAKDQGKPLTSGGRVLTVVGRGQSLSEARKLAYKAIGHIKFEGAYHRTDVAADLD